VGKESNRCYGFVIVRFRELVIVCSIAIAPGDMLLFGMEPQQSQAAGNKQNQFMSPDQLDSLVAPIALYPDSLVRQNLAASTYPLQICCRGPVDAAEQQSERQEHRWRRPESRTSIPAFRPWWRFPACSI
jgi:hypothetical protein